MTTNALAERGQSTATEETGLSTRVETDHELQRSNAEATARYEMEGAIVMARRFPRSEDKAFASLIRSCQRASFAADCCYSFPRGGEKIEGPSVYVAKEGARFWGNIRFGFDVIRDDENSRQIRGWAWDLETNTKSSYDASFAKLVYRKKGGWVKPDERDLRELTNRQGAILVRNCILDLLPSDLIAEAVRESKKTLEKGAAADPDAARKAIIKAFSSLGVSVEQLESYLKHPLGQSSPAEIADLRTVYKSIADGNSKWSEYVHSDKQPADNGAVSGADLTKKAQESGSDSGNATGLDQSGEGPQTASGTFATDGQLSAFGVEINDKAGDPKINRTQNASLMQELSARRNELGSDEEFEFLQGKLKANAERLKK